jgi:hypothetical protein
LRVIGCASAGPTANVSNTARYKIRARIALTPRESKLYPEAIRMHVLRIAGKASP